MLAGRGSSRRDLGVSQVLQFIVCTGGLGLDIIDDRSCTVSDQLIFLVYGLKVPLDSTSFMSKGWNCQPCVTGDCGRRIGSAVNTIETKTISQCFSDIGYEVETYLTSSVGVGICHIPHAGSSGHIEVCEKRGEERVAGERNNAKSK